MGAVTAEFLLLALMFVGDLLVTEDHSRKVMDHDDYRKEHPEMSLDHIGLELAPEFLPEALHFITPFVA